MDLSVVAADLGDPAGEDEHEPGVRVHVPLDALSRLVLHFGEDQAANLAPSQDVAVREVLRRLGVDHRPAGV
jgi:hypothetical protein